MKKHGSVYLHVGNSGTTFKVIDEGYGPTVVVSTGAFGNINHEFKLYTTREGLAQLSELFGKAALEEGYSEPYCHAARVKGLTNLGDAQASAGESSKPSAT